MLGKFTQQLLKTEKEWYGREARDKKLIKKLTAWLDAKKDEDTLRLAKHVDLKYFIRSYRAAFAKLINKRLKLSEIDLELIKFNKKMKNENKKEISKAQFVNKILTKILKPNLYIELGDMRLSIKTNPSATHLGNGYVHEIGLYSNIWPSLNLITDCKGGNNKEFAKLFLKFADAPFQFKLKHLIVINKKFEKPEMKKTAKHYCKSLTEMAMHYVFFEPARRIAAEVEEECFKVGLLGKIPIAANIISTLKLIRDGVLDSLDDAFSPDSEYMLITKDGVNKLAKKITAPIIENIGRLGMFRVKQEHEKKKVSPNAMAAHMVYPDSEDFDSEATDEYSGKTVKISQKSPN